MKWRYGNALGVSADNVRADKMAFVPRVFAQLWLAMLVCLLVCGCAKKRDAQRRPPTDALTRALQTADDALAASRAIANASFSDCESVLRGLQGLDTRDWDDAVLRGLVEEILQSSRGLCSQQSPEGWPPGVATSLAHSLLAANPQRALSALEAAPRSAVILRRRAELLFANGQDAPAREVLIDSLALEEDAEVRGHAARLLRLAGELERSLSLCSQAVGDGAEGLVVLREKVATLAALGRGDEVVAAMALGELHQQTELAQAAALAARDLRELAGTPGAGLALLLAASTSPSLGSAERAAILRRASQLEGADADVWSALAEAEEADGHGLAAIAAWDEAASYAHGAERPILAPIRLLHTMGNEPEATARAERLAADARAKKSSDDLHLASQGYRYAGRADEAVSLAREALAERPGDGRLQSELAHRLEEAGKTAEAVTVLSTLLVCGSRGRPWHRHELVARLAALVGEPAVSSAIDAVACQVVDPEGLSELRK